MKKVSQNGFILAETIAVAAVVITALVLIFTQFTTISNSYTKAFTYNNVDKLYSANNIRDYIISDGLSNMISSLNELPYIEINTCSTDYFIEYNYCSKLMENLNVKTAILTKADMSYLKSADLSVFSQKMQDFINMMTNGEGYRLIAEFDDGNFATLLINENNYVDSNSNIEISAKNISQKNIYNVGNNIEFEVEIKNLSASEITTDIIVSSINVTNSFVPQNTTYILNTQGEIYTIKVGANQTITIPFTTTIARSDAGKDCAIIISNEYTKSSRIEWTTEKIYDLVINYAYESGAMAAPSYHEKYLAGETYSVPSPNIVGYTANYSLMTGSMPDHDLSYTVVYSKTVVDPDVPIPDPDVPDEPTTTITRRVLIVWDDYNDAAGERPNSVSVQLLRNGVAYGTSVSLSTANNWRHDWTDLDSRYNWTVEVDPVPIPLYDYSVKLEGISYIMTFTYSAAPEPDVPLDPDDPDVPIPDPDVPL